MTPKIEAHMKGGQVIGNVDPDADIDFLLRAASFGVGPTEPSPSWTKTLVLLHNRLAQVDADRAALQSPPDEDGPF